MEFLYHASERVCRNPISISDQKSPSFFPAVVEKRGNNWGTIKFLCLTFHDFRFPNIPPNSLKLRYYHTFDPRRLKLGCEKGADLFIYFFRTQRWIEKSK